MSASSYPPLTLVVEPVSEIDTIAPRWRALQDRLPHSFFQSWHWIGCLLTAVPRTAHLLSMKAEGETVAMAILFGLEGEQNSLVHGAKLALNRVGEASYDCIFPEYADFLCVPGYRHSALQTLLHAMAEANCIRLELGGVAEGGDQVMSPPGWYLRQFNRQGFYQVDLAHLRSQGIDYASTLSRNTRQQINRSIREIESRLGPLSLHVAQNSEEALEMLERLAVLHQSYWQRRGMSGAFSEPFFRAFHEKLIATGFDAGVLELISVSAGNQEIGLLYDFCYRQQVYYYQSGFVTPQGKHDRPGLVSHFLNIQRHLEGGSKIYDFMAGDQRYKASLAERVGVMIWLEAHRWSMKYRLTNALRNAKSWSVEAFGQK